MLARYDIILQDRLGNALQSVDVYIRKGSAQVNGGQSGTSPMTATVFNPGGIKAGDTVRINAGTTEYAVNSVTATTVVLAGFAGTLALTDGDRLSVVSDLPVLYSNAAGSGSPLSQPLQTDVNGRVTCYTEKRFHQHYYVNGALSAAVLKEDVQPTGEENIQSDAYNSGSAVAFIKNAKRALGSADKLESWRVADAEVISFSGTGIISAVGLSVGDIVATGNMALTGDLTVDDITADDITCDDITCDDVSMGDLTVSGAVSLPAGSIETADLAANAVTFLTQAVATTDVAPVHAAAAYGTDWQDVVSASLSLTGLTSADEVFLVGVLHAENNGGGFAGVVSIRESTTVLAESGFETSGSTSGIYISSLVVHRLVFTSSSRTLKLSHQCLAGTAYDLNNSNGSSPRRSKLMAIQLKK